MCHLQNRTSRTVWRLHSCSSLMMLLLAQGCWLDHAGQGDAAVDAATEPSCADFLLLDSNIELDTAGPDTQIHATAAFDGRGIWLAYNLPEGSGGFDVFAARLECDGSYLVEPFRVNTTTQGNDVDPEIAIGDGNVYLTWTSDSGAAENNMDVFYRSFTADGTPLMAEDAILETTRSGVAEPGNVMNARITALPNASFAITGARGIAATQPFQMFVQRIDASGQLLSEALEYFEDGVAQTDSSITGTSNGDIFASWVRTEQGQSEQLVHTVFAAGSSTAQPSPPELVTDAVAGAPGYSSYNGSSEQLYLTYGTGRSFTLSQGGHFGAPPPSLVIGSASHDDHSPSVAAVAGGGAVVWYRRISGIRNRVRAVPFHFNGTSFVLGQEVEVSAGPAAPYGVATCHVTGDVYFVAWSSGVSPDFRLLGRFVELSM